jgi:hypothetical protein
MTLKPDSIYALPDGHELIARLDSEGGYMLHDPLRGVAAAPIYLVAPSGELLSWSQRTTWTQADLRDTGRASRPEIQRLVLL